MPYETFLIKRSGPIATVLFNRPEKLNPIKEFFAALSTNRAGDITYADAHLGLAAFASEDMQEAIAAFREKRKGEFHNR